jgi:transcription elongation factor GreA
VNRINPDHLVTADGLQLIRDRHAELEVEVVKRREDLVLARAHGDLSENAEYDAARTRLNRVHAELAKIKSIVNNCVIPPTPPDTNFVRFGAYVHLVDQVNEKRRFRIVSELEAYLHGSEHFAYFKAPLAAMLIGKKVGETVHFKDLQHDILRKYKIAAVSYEGFQDNIEDTSQ